VKDVQAIVDTCKSIRPEVIVLCHGGPIATPKEAQYLLDYCGALDGFYGASSMERLPTEQAITAETKKFTALKLSR
jgi:predicted TIM-barrel enzyme